MKKIFSKLTGSSDEEPVRQKQVNEQIEAARREAMGQQGGPPPGSGGPPQGPPGGPPPGASPGGPPMAPPGFGAPGAGDAGASLTPASERQEITGMALEQLQERRRAPTEGVQLEGVPPPDIPSEVLRDNALNEILQRKERLDAEYRRKHGGGAKKSSGDAPKIFKGLKKGTDTDAEEAAPAEQAAPASEAAPAAPSGAKPRSGAKQGPKKKLKLRPLKSVSTPEPEPEEAEEPDVGHGVDESATTTDEGADEALASIKGVGPVTREALLERFSSVEAIKDADVEELTEVSGVGPALATRIKSAL